VDTAGELIPPHLLSGIGERTGGDHHATDFDGGCAVKAMRRWQITIAIFFIISLLTASADALDATDYTRMHNLGTTAIQLQEDMLNVQRGAQGKGFECLTELYHNLETISIRIEALTSVVHLASSMVNKSDEQTVLATLNMDATSFLRQIEIGRNGINLTAGHCSWNNIVACTRFG
jgi:hypothetical protein